MTAVRLEQDLDAGNGRIERVCSQGSSLNGIGRGRVPETFLDGRKIFPIRDNAGFEWELQISSVVHGHRVGIIGSLNDSVEGRQASIFEVNTELEWKVVGSLPQFNPKREANR